MKTYLPHYFKRIGILLVIIAAILSCLAGVDDFRQGFSNSYNDVEYSYDELKNNPELHPEVIVESYFTDAEENTFTWISLLFSISGFIIYLFSKEKIDDEYIQQIRLKSILQAFLISWIIYGIAKLFSFIIPMDGIYILQMQLIAYVIIFRYNKNKELSDEEIALED
ncbi:hypothetical protein [Ancylomarina sp. 16SWW S1-10-2]|uniref:hypothetical protein n=1 Tax=Ancylomarina sp. 16SWW S1-10-2 TaxID=2499681 RepID=UPI0012AD380A|nr:hypothetical protein [Ancylomarina sp. 16SWW S1-10-2]MRT94068.1 hypothetical protein [Ancylomarina sp. 16SWW S1-10-2]